MRAGAVAHALYSELGEFRNRRHARTGQNIDRGFPAMMDDRLAEDRQTEDWRADSR